VREGLLARHVLALDAVVILQEEEHQVVKAPVVHCVVCVAGVRRCRAR
jgi:hypothetical protein